MFPRLNMVDVWNEKLEGQSNHPLLSEDDEMKSEQAEASRKVAAASHERVHARSSLGEEPILTS
ncbi:hypothetical protein BH11ARM2_BH11ARM2_07270 [soil metagenome]